jgi:hypothetical protein
MRETLNWDTLNGDSTVYGYTIDNQLTVALSDWLSIANEFANAWQNLVMRTKWKWSMALISIVEQWGLP